MRFSAAMKNLYAPSRRMIAAVCLSCLVSVLAFLCGCVSDLPSDLPVHELESRMQKATDPGNIGRSISSYVQRQSLRIPGFFSDTVFLVELKYKKPGRMRIDTYSENQLLASIIFNGDAAWVVEYRNRDVSVLHGEAFDRIRALNHMSTPGIAYSRIFPQIEAYVTSIDGKKCYKLVCHSDVPQTEPFILYVDSEDFLIRRVVAKFMLDGKPVDSDATIGNYAMMEGVMVPEKVFDTQNGIPTESTVIDYRINVNIPDSEFLPPIFDRRGLRR